MSVTLVKTSAAYAFRYECDFCARAPVIATTLPAGWEAIREQDGRLTHICSGCWFEQLVADLERSA